MCVCVLLAGQALDLLRGQREIKDAKVIRRARQVAEAEPEKRPLAEVVVAASLESLLDPFETGLCRIQAPPEQQVLLVAELVEHEQGMVGGTPEVPVERGASLLTAGLADRAVRVQDQPD